MIPFHVVISSLLRLSSIFFFLFPNSCKNISILRVTGVIIPKGSKMEVKVARASRFVFSCSMFSSFLVNMENLSGFVFMLSQVTLSFIWSCGLVTCEQSFSRTSRHIDALTHLGRFLWLLCAHAYIIYIYDVLDLFCCNCICVIKMVFYGITKKEWAWYNKKR